MRQDTASTFRPVAPDVHVLRYPLLDVNVTLVVGGESALVVDTLSTDAQAVELLAAVRRVTDLPLVVVNTHHHFDHCFGNAVFARAGATVWGHEETAVLLSRRGDELRRDWHEEWADREPALAAGLAAVAVHPPERTVRQGATLDLGGRTVVLRHFGRGHTAGDLVVLVPDAAVVVTGDLVEESGPPQFEDSYPLDWPEALAALLEAIGDDDVVVPGHGALVGRGFVRDQHDRLSALDWLIREADADGAPAERAAAQAPYDPHTSLIAIRRGFGQLTGRG